ncbi:hypothetical protein OSB04_un001329 [Centaurea solstitialis]|uniref:Short-chain dehydrogenase reductase 3b-like n=1 Tax=Centaurea solstitialis TaxID=347529 RepID=A0AA38W533_9ASTR|nr:hypothetical protein OSB04_un001329 [Centaurea solstitialis]
MINKPRLEGKVALITGGASGIGEASARLFLEHGARVVIADVQDELGHKVVTSCNSPNISYVHCDVREEGEVAHAVAQTLAEYGGLDVLFSNAGVMGPMTSLLEMDLEAFDTTMAINVRGVAATIKHAARAMVARKVCGSIICTASVAAFLGGAAPHGYTVSKHAMLGLMKTACNELGAHGIRVNCVSPFGVATPMSCKAYGLEPSQVEAGCCEKANLKGVVLKPSHVAEAALFLASDDSAYVSGQSLGVDGGFSVVSHSYTVVN